MMNLLKSSRPLAFFLFATAYALAQVPLAQVPKEGSIFDSGLAGSLLQADTVPLSVDLSGTKPLEGYGTPSGIGPGSYFQIKGSGFSPTTRTWLAPDFAGSNAPTSLDGVTVSINNKPAFVEYISPTQVNVVVPDDPVVGPVDVTITNAAGETFTVHNIQKNAVAPGVLAPSFTAFNVNGKQYAIATFGFTSQFVGDPNLIPGGFVQPAKPGDTIFLYGIGFGDVDPPLAAGVIAPGGDRIKASLSIKFDQTPASVSYAGHYATFVGLYLFVVTVPDVPDGDHLITFTLDGQPLQQVMYLTVKR